MLNYYKCPCGEEWQDNWTCACNDRCPKCNKEIEPYASEGEPTFSPNMQAALQAVRDMPPAQPIIKELVETLKACQLALNVAPRFTVSKEPRLSSYDVAARVDKALKLAEEI